MSLGNKGQDGFKQHGSRVLQSFYKQELDNQLQERTQQKQMEKIRLEEQRRQFNGRMAQQEQLQKLKDLSYKNYYQMLMSSQDNNFKNLKEVRDGGSQKNKRALSVYEGELQVVTEDRDRQRKLQEMKNRYRNELMQQMKDNEDQKELRKHQKQEELKEGRRFHEMTKLSAEEQKAFHKQSKQKYKEELDRISAGRSRDITDSQHFRQKKSLSTYDLSDQEHNILNNPMPYNIQNPYILKEMQRSANKGYFANIATNNLHT